MISLLSARKAHEFALSYRNEIQIEYIRDCIYKAIRQGKTQVLIAGQLTDESKKFLEKNGYKVIPDFAINFTKIIW